MKPSRLCVIGLDGVGLDLARHLAGQGVMPNLARLFGLGRSFGLSSPLPEVSPVCWGSLFSGLDPGGHGVYGFAEHIEGGYGVRPVDSGDFKAPRLWDLAGQNNKRSVVLNVPLTYPPRPLDGIMLSGFVVPDLSRAVFPAYLYNDLKEMGYRPEAELDLGRDDPPALAADLKRVLEKRLAFFERMLDESWDLFIAVITDTDRVNHFFWPALWDQGHPLSQTACNLYRLADSFLGKLWQRLGPMVKAGELCLLLAADHAFGPIEQEFYLNRWLMEEGYLHLEQGPEGDAIAPQTRALALDPGRIYLHQKGRFPAGGVNPGPEAVALAEEIASKLGILQLPGVDGHSKPALEAVHRGAELYSGPHVAQAPDLVLRAAPGVSVRAGMAKPAVFGRSHLWGTHRPQGALGLWLGPWPGGKNPTKLTDIYEFMSWSLLGDP